MRTSVTRWAMPVVRSPRRTRWTGTCGGTRRRSSVASDITLVISTAEGREEWLDAALRAAQASAHYGRLLVASSPFYETGALAEALTMVGEDERFLFIGDSMHIMSSAFFDFLPEDGSAWLF